MPIFDSSLAFSFQQLVIDIEDVLSPVALNESEPSSSSTANESHLPSYTQAIVDLNATYHTRLQVDHVVDAVQSHAE